MSNPITISDSQSNGSASLREVNIERFNINNIPARLEILDTELNTLYGKVASIITEKNHLQAILGLIEALNETKKI